jgi:hypothetical protein
MMGLLYGEAPVAIRLTSDMAALASPENKARLELIAKRAPVMFDVIHPRTCYSTFDNLGLCKFYIKQKKLVSEIRAIWGKESDKALKDKKDTDMVDYNEYWDTVNHCAWVAGTQIFLKPHKLPFIPVANGVVEGSDLFQHNDKDTRQPFLYTIWKSGLWKVANLIMTYNATKVNAFGQTAQNKFTSPNEGAKTPDVDWNHPMGMFALKPGESVEPYIPNIIDPQLDKHLQYIENKIAESSMYRQALGEPLGANAPFSMVALLSQAGRLPLVPYQRMCSDILAKAMYYALILIRDGKADVKAYADSGMVSIEPKNIPDVFDITCDLKIDVPTDERQNAVIAAQLVQAGIISKETAMQRWLNIQQPDDEQQKIWAEQLADSQHNLNMQMQAAQAQQNLQLEGQNQAMQMQGQAQPPQGQSQGQPQGEVPPELLAQMQGGGMPPPGQTGAEQGMAGLPLSEPLPIQGQPMV